MLALVTKLLAMLTPLGSLLTGVNVMGVLKGVGTNLKTYWKIYLPVLLVLIQIGTLYGWYNEHNNLVKEKSLHRQDIMNFKNAQAIANAQANEESRVLKREAKINADQADTKYSTLLSEYRFNLMRYKANQSGTYPSINNHFYPTPSRVGPSSSPTVPPAVSTDTLVISMSDAQICAVNTARLESVHDWVIETEKESKQK